MRIVLWNTEWAKPHTPRGRIIRRLILDTDPDVICLTEAVPAMLPDDGHWIEPGDEAPYPRKDNGEKALLWSRWPWRDVQDVLPEGTTGRFVEATLDPPDSPALRVTGVCIPWHRSGVRGGSRKVWEDHLAFIRDLDRLHTESDWSGARMVLGDYNQRLPRSWTPKYVHKELDAYLSGHGFNVVTEGHDDPVLIDHLALTGGWTGRIETIWPTEVDGTRLSDHVGIVLEIEPPHPDH